MFPMLPISSPNSSMPQHPIVCACTQVLSPLPQMGPYQGHLSDPSLPKARTPYIIISIHTAKLSRFIISVDILWHVSLADCLFTSDFPLFADNPLLSPFICESCRVYWLHQTGFLISLQCCLHLIIVFPFSTLHIALLFLSLFHCVMLNVPPSICPPRAL